MVFLAGFAIVVRPEWTGYFLVAMAGAMAIDTARVSHKRKRWDDENVARVEDLNALAMRFHEWPKKREGSLTGLFQDAAGELDRLLGCPAGDELWEKFEGNRDKLYLPRWGSQESLARAARKYIRGLA